MTVEGLLFFGNCTGSISKMERDFMGFNSKDSVVVVKEEAVEDSAGLRWPSSSKVSTLTQFMSLKSAQDEKPLNFLSGRNAPQGFGGLSTVDAFYSAHKRQYNEFQNFAAAPMKQQFLGGIPVAVPVSIIPAIGSVAGTTGPWFNSNGSAALAQLTIFYGGTINVFDDITPEKAQAIMFLAGNGCTPNVVQPRFQVQASASKPATVEGTSQNKAPNSFPVSGLSSPMSVSSHPIIQSVGNSVNKDERKTSKSAMISLPPVSKSEPPKIVSLLGSFGATTIMPTAVPQARKASLARFLEKRKERVMSSTPYNLSKKPDDCTAPDSNDACFSGTSNITISPLSVETKT